MHGTIMRGCQLESMFACRRTVRSFIRFLDPQSAATFKAGADLLTIEEFQRKTSFLLPWQVCFESHCKHIRHGQGVSSSAHACQ